jgi:hypothetical protein
LLCLLVGAMVDRGLLGAPGRGVIESAGRALALGLGTVGGLSLLADSLGLGVSLTTVMGGAALVVALLLWPALRKRGKSGGSGSMGIDSAEGNLRAAAALKHAGGAASRRWDRTTVLCAAMLAAAALFLGFAAYTGWIRPACQMDALVRWMFKAKALALEGTLLGPLSTDPAFHFTHQRYPPLVSHVANLPALFSGAFNDRIASAIFPAFAVALACIAYGSLRRTAGRVQGCLAALWVASLPLVAFREGPPPLGVPPGSGAFSALADVPLALFAFCAALAALDGIENRRPRAYLEAGLMLGFAALTKNEGLAFAGVAAAAVLACASRNRFRSTAAVVAVAALLYLLLWGRLAVRFPALDEHYPGRLNWDALAEGIHRLPSIAAAMASQILFLPSWNLTGVGVLALLLLSGRDAVDRGGRFLLLVCVLQVAVYAGAYTITAWTSPAAVQSSPTGDPVPFLMNLTLGRLLLHVAPIAVAAALRAAPLGTRALRPSPRS